MNRRSIYLIWIGFLTLGLNAQDTLKKVVLVDYYTASHAIIPRDSFPKSTFIAFPEASMADILSRQNSVFIKNYGPGNIATISHRSLSAHHTGVLWNGLNLQNNTLGTIDFSLLPATGFEKSSWQPGTINNSSALASAGGALILSNNSDTENSLSLNLSGGTYLDFSQSLALNLSSSKQVFSFGAYNRYAKNNFPIPKAEEKGLAFRKREHAQTLHYGARADYAYYFPKFHSLRIAAWFGSADRQVPAALYSAETHAKQKDRFMRSLIAYQFAKNKHKLHIKQAVFAEDLRFSDDNLINNSYMSFLNFISDIQYNYHISPRSLLFSSLQFQFQNGFNTTYLHRESSIHASIGYIYENKKNFNLRIFIKPSYIQEKYVNINPQLYLKYKLPKGFAISMQHGRIFRAPGMNDRYWNPGGNPHLLPEDGFASDIHFYFSHKNTFISAAAFANLLKNRIVWIPQGSYWSPQNIDQTRGLGMEWVIKQDWLIGAHQVGVHMHYTYTHARVIRPDNPSLHKKNLIYTPEHLAGINLQYSWKNLNLGYNQRFTSKRFTTFDNSEFLPFYTTGDFTANYSFPLKKLSIRSFLTLQNIFNQYYEVVALRPMPGISFQTGIHLLIHIKK